MDTENAVLAKNSENNEENANLSQKTAIEICRRKTVNPSETVEQNPSAIVQKTDHFSNNSQLNVKNDSLLVKNDNLNVKSDSVKVKNDSSYLKHDRLIVNNDNLNAKSDSFNNKCDIANGKSDSSDVSIDTKKIVNNGIASNESFNAKKDSLSVKSDSSNVKSDSSNVKNDSSSVKNDSSNVNNDNLNVKNDSSDVNINASNVSFDTNTLNDVPNVGNGNAKSDSLNVTSVKLHNSVANIDTSDVSFDSNTFIEDPDLSSGNSNAKSDSLTVKSDTSSVKNDSSNVNNDSLNVKNDSSSVKNDRAIDNIDTSAVNIDSSEVIFESSKVNLDSSDDNIEPRVSNVNTGDSNVTGVDAEGSDGEQVVSKKRKLSDEGAVSRRKVSRIIDSDSDEDEAVGRRESEDDSGGTVRGARVEEHIFEEETFKKSRLAALCDSDSSEAENDTRSNEPESEPEETVKKRKPTKKKAPQPQKPKKMTGREALEQRREIASESSRMLRERQVALPYHKPKQRTLREFLAKRSKFATAIPIVAPPSLAIKMSSQHLELISKRLEEREKEAEEFFKSDSDVSEAEDTVDEETEKAEEEESNVEGEEKLAEPQKQEKNVEAGEEIIEDKGKSGEEESHTIEDEGHNIEDKGHTIEDEGHTIEDQGHTIEEEGKTSESEVVTNEVEAETSEEPRDYEFNLDDSEETEEPRHLPASNLDPQNPQMPQQPQNPHALRTQRLLDALKDKLPNAMPKLSGGPNLLIDLERGITKPDEVTELMQRFAQHTSKKSPKKMKKGLVSVVSVNVGGEISNERLAVELTDKEVPAIHEKPGVMLMRLRSELQSQMALRRAELWQRKQNAKLTYDSATDEKETCGGEEDDILDDEDEEDLTESEDEEVETKSAFVDDEVEEDEEEDAEAEADSEAENAEDDSEVEESCQTNVRQMKRIIKPSEDDSDEDETDNEPSHIKAVTDSCDEDDCPPAGQTRNHITPKRQIHTSKSELNFLTPVCHLTGLQAGEQDGDRFLQGGCSPSPDIALPPDEPSPLKGNWQKQLFSDVDIAPTQTNVDDLCSGNFPSQTQEVVKVTSPVKLPEVSTVTSPVKLPEVEAPNTQELMELCSGKFTATDGLDHPKTSNVTVETVILGQTQEIKSFDDTDDKFISQLLDEQEMEEFKKKFQSPVIAPSQTSDLPVNSDVPVKISFESSDEDDTVDPRKKKRNAIVDSDEESDVEPEEAIDLHDKEEEEEPNKDVEYDSEENEIELVKEAPGKSKKLRAADFFEEEAELSESEWGSEDEDEGGLDILDTELGDSEKFDEDKVRTEIEKLHMRRILDDDSREVKILQELLLEDGELHGAGRQRQFRWKNIDSQGNETEGQNEEDQPVDEEDEENELEWRKKRHAREIFLRKNSQGSQFEDDCDLTLSTDSQVIQLGRKAIIRNNSTSVRPVKKVVNVAQPFSLLNKRGSFLSRTDQVLERVAEFTKIQEMTVGGAKKSRNFVFQSVNTSEASTSAQDKKRKAQADGTPAAIKKIRLNTLSPALQKKTDKNLKKKLFGGGKGW